MKYLLIVTVSIVVSLTFGTQTHAATPPDSCFAFNAGTGTITNYYSHENNNSANPTCTKDVDIPSTIGGVTVTAITGPTVSTGAFQYKQLSSLTIPSSVTNIGLRAFRYNLLTTVTIPSSVTTIGSDAFMGNDLSSIVMQNGVTSIASQAFSGNELTSVTIPSSVTSVQARAFASNHIATAIFEGSVASFGTTIFDMNPVSAITYGGTTYTPTTPIPEQCYQFAAGAITNYLYADMNIIKNTGIGCLSRQVDIPSTIGGVPVTNIADSAFYRKSMQQVTIPNTITSIGEYAFQDNQLTSVTIPGSVTSVGNEAFWRNNLVSVTILDGVTSIGNYAFYQNDLTSVVMPNTIISIGDWAFYDNQLTSVVLPSNLQTIGANAFSNNKLDEVSVPSSVMALGNYAFANNNIADFVIHGNPSTIGTNILVGNKNAVSSIAYDGTVYNAPTSQVVLPQECLAFDSGTATITDYRYADIQLIKNQGIACLATNISIPGVIGATPVQIIGVGAFRDNYLTEAVVPVGVTTIDNSSFRDNYLTAVSIADGVTTIENNAFTFNKLTTVDVPNSLTTIEFGAFALQSNYGRDIYKCINNAPCLSSSDPSIVQATYDSLHYVRLYTADPSNPAGLKDDFMDEYWWINDDVNDNLKNDILGGHLVNPASLELQYKSESSQEIMTSKLFVGKLGDAHIQSYNVSDGPEFTLPFIPVSPTPEEQQIIDAMFAAYYRIGDSVTIDPPAIDGYITPPSQTFVLGAGTNEFSYVYATADSPDGGSQTGSGGGDDQLADTGVSLLIYAIAGVGMSVLGATAIIRRLS